MEHAPSQPDLRSDTRREVATAFVLIALGGGAVLFAASRVWLSLTALRPAPFGPLSAHVKGHTEFSALSGLAIVTLLGAVLIVVTGRWGRTALGILLVVVALACGWLAIRGFQSPTTARLQDLLGGAEKVGGARIVGEKHMFWPVLAIIGSVLSLVGGLFVVGRASRWPQGLGRRYDAPVEAAKSDDPWRLLDRGEDPTMFDR